MNTLPHYTAISLRDNHVREREGRGHCLLRPEECGQSIGAEEQEEERKGGKGNKKKWQVEGQEVSSVLLLAFWLLCFSFTLKARRH